jgi:hypothetical protein
VFPFFSKQTEGKINWDESEQSQNGNSKISPEKFLFCTEGKHFIVFLPVVSLFLYATSDNRVRRRWPGG